MIRLNRTAFFLALFTLSGGQEDEKRKDNNIYEQMCQEFGRQPFFDLDILVSKRWRIYYTWQMDIETRCLDIKFKIAAPMTIRRIFHDMHDYLQEQPVWGSAVLKMTMGRARHEMLLFDDQGPAGRFYGVPNVVRDGSLVPQRGAVPFLKFLIRLLSDGKYLIIMDCYMGVSSLAAHADNLPTQDEIAEVVSALGFGKGHYACFQSKDRLENMIED